LDFHSLLIPLQGLGSLRDCRGFRFRNDSLHAQSTLAFTLKANTKIAVLLDHFLGQPRDFFALFASRQLVSQSIRAADVFESTRLNHAQQWREGGSKTAGACVFR
jgi:hypothetical protein